MQNQCGELAHLKATLSNGQVVIVRCEKICGFHKTFLKGMVQNVRYVVDIVGASASCFPEASKKRTYTARWWWRLLDEDCSRVAVSLHLLRLRAKLL